MLSLSTLKKNSDFIFGDENELKPFVFDNIPIQSRDHFALLCKNGFINQANTIFTEYRKQYIRQLGFIPMSANQAVFSMGGYNWSWSNNGTEIFRNNRLYQTVNNRSKIVAHHTEFSTKPFFFTRFVITRPELLKHPIPYGILLKINQIKQLNVFDDMVVVAPQKACESIINPDPILLGVITTHQEMYRASQEETYFIAQW